MLKKKKRTKKPQQQQKKPNQTLVLPVPQLETFGTDKVA